MVLTTSELIATLQQEVRILVHLAGKVDASMLDYRPTPKQRSTLELLQYMAIMGPTQLTVIELSQKLALFHTIANADIDAYNATVAFRGNVGLLLRDQRPGRHE